MPARYQFGVRLSLEEGEKVKAALLALGETGQKALKGITDMGPREIAVLAPLVVLTIFFGVQPQPILDVTGPAVKKLVSQYEAAVRTQAAELKK